MRRSDGEGPIMSEALWPYERVLTDLRRRIEDGELTGRTPTRMALAEEPRRPSSPR